MSFRPPPEFDDYVILHPIGHGSMGNVYLAEDSVLARQVAIKFIAAPEPNVEARQRFLIEARAAARVQHPNVVTIYRVGELDDHPYLITEFARGRSLERIARPVPWQKALEIGIDVARGLAAAHRKGVLHCDLKASNVVLTDEGSAKLLDFGLATLLKVVEPAQEGASGGPIPASHARGSGAVLGTPDTMAPEIWRGEAPTRRSDVYSFGALFHELCAGTAPFHDVPPAELARVVSERDAPLLERRAPGVDPRFAQIVDRCLRRAPAERFASGDDLRQALEQLARTAGGALAVPEGNPYRGLRAFDVHHRGLFFGRSAEIGGIVDRLRTEAFLLVAGDSGVGKSSVCRAGVVPTVTLTGLGDGRVFSTCTLVPGKHPRAALAAALALALGLEATELAGWIDQDLGALAHAVGQRLGAATGLLVFIDQAEELITLSDRDEARAVDAALGALTAQVPGVRLLATVRADFLARVADLPSLGEALPQALYFLRPLPPERVREVILGPTGVTGVRFESDELVEALVEATASAEGGLPLLQFALAELWEARDVPRGLITTAALEAMGGVAGALSRHGDVVVASMRPAARVEARRMLVRLVTLENTRVRRSEIELHAAAEPASGALDALVRARLVVAQDGEDGGAYELAHEVLIHGWATLRGWLVEDAESREVRERLALAAAEWKRLREAPEALLNARQLAEIGRVAPVDVTEGEAAFLEASRAAAVRGRWVRRAAIAAAPLLLALGYGVFVIEAARDRRARVEHYLTEGREGLDAARRAAGEAQAEAAEAFRLFDAQQVPRAEEVWARALARDAESARSFRQASSSLEAALAQDSARADVRALLGEALFERAQLADRDRKAEQRDELVARFTLYDADATLLGRWNTPARVALDSDPPGATASLLRFERTDGGALALTPVRELGATPLTGVALESGSYVFSLASPGRAGVLYPLLARRGAEHSLRVELPLLTAVPEGFVYVPAGRFLFGSGEDEESRRGFFEAVPLHEITLESYLIAREQVTFADWIAFLRARPEEKATRAPRVPVKVGLNVAVDLSEGPDGVWRLLFQSGARTYSAREGEPIRYQGRSRRVVQDWTRFPVVGVSADDGQAYAAWLRAQGSVPFARLCTGLEWEKAARGADGREYPHGDKLAPDDANFDETYDRDGMGPDEIGAHPASRSPFGIDDMSGNSFEWTTSTLVPGDFVVRGGSYFHDRKTIKLVTRTVSTSSLHDATVGLRLCSSLLPR